MRRLAHLTIAFLLVVSIALTGASLDASASPLALATAPALGAAESFAVLGGSTVTSTGATIVGQDLGVYPGTSITGFPPGLVVGTTHNADAVAQQAQSDVTTAYNNLAGQACDTSFIPPTDLGGMTLTPGVYCFGSTAGLTGTLTLSGGPLDIWVFKIGSALTTAPGSRVLLTGGAQSCNVYWQVTSSATLDTTTSFVGNILALSSITLNTSASLDGRALARTGAVTLDTNNVTFTACAALPGTPVPTATDTLAPPTATAIAATATALAATQTSVAATQTVIIAPTLTAIVGTNTAIAATSTAIAATLAARGGGDATQGVGAQTLPESGFRPGVRSILARQPASGTYGDYGDLVLEIPRLGVKTAILGVPPTKGSWDVTWLSDQAGWLQGTAFPTWAGNSVLTGHVYSASGQAGPFVDLSSLQYGDRIIIHAWGQKYLYEVRSNGTVSPNSTATALKHEKLPWITLITCRDYNPKTETYKSRTVVRAVQVAIE